MIIARDPETQETFIIEKARHHRDNIFDVSDDEEVANQGEAFDSGLVTVYYCEGPQAFAAPFHVDCYKVLADAYEPRDIDLATLYDTLESLCPRDDSVYRSHLDFDYDKPSHKVAFTAYDFSFASPNRVSDDDISVGGELKRNSRRSGSSTPHILNGERLTPTRIYDDMPWAKYILHVKTHKLTMDMALYYKNLVALGNGRLKEGDFSLPVRMHLQNRCRLWGVCTRLLEECSTNGYSANKTKTKTKKQEPLIKYTKKTDEILNGAIQSPMPLLTFPPCSRTIYDSVSLMEEMKDLEKAEPVIRVYWGASKQLVGIGIYDPVTDTARTLGSKSLFRRTQDAQIPPDNWLAAIFIVTKEVPQKIPKVWRRVIVGIKFVFLYDDFVSFGEPVGDVRVLVPKPWHTVVGIGATWKEGRGLESLVLLQQDQEKVPKSAHCRVGMEYPDDLEGLEVSKVFRPDPRIANFLWRGWIPCRPGIWPTYPVRLDPLMPMPVETLMLTKPLTDEDYNFVLGVDAQFRGFEVLFEYKDKTKTVRRSIGLATAMHYFVMDSDEQITKCYITGKDKIEGIRLVTDKTKHFIVGRPGPEEMGLAKQGLSMESIEGFHCRWSDDRNTSLTSLGVLTLEFSSVNLAEEREDKDQDNILGHYWVPERPQTRFPIEESGQIHGRTPMIERLRYPGVGLPSRQAVVTWLDCSKPLETISITMCHSTTTKLLMMTSMVFKYAEGHEPMYFGPFPIDSPEHEKGVKKQDRCACIHGGSFEQEIEDIPHYEPDKWRVYGGYLKALRVWETEIGVLTGLQFVAQESESQKWGFCDGEYSHELDLQSKEGMTWGIKFFLDSNGRNHVSEDIVVVAVQRIKVPKNGDNPQRLPYKKSRYM
ncbi:uncharacterized protein FTJAE_1309 [Fusarium tjaetaba]|uniref:Uncharacterized protein n=1 Tax=Fusarium tjaetaba TaxID=1567544 RepID=A0A8H5S8F7_9HYPO|nr:uncharacterized protein FTJAE_1309 [Fusarium tjaetaba]KAF5648476.1 hypothetical protein FTJAE_1309 [Fusarium tjaetaba]